MYALSHGVRRFLSKPAVTTEALKGATAGLHTTNPKDTPKQGHALGKAIQYLRFKLFTDPRHHLDHDKWAKLFVIEGNIKSGKSAFAEEFARKLDLRHFPAAKYDYVITSRTNLYTKEFIEFWSQPGSPLAKFWNLSLDRTYTNPEDWAHLGRFQSAMIRSRLYQYVDAFIHLIRIGQGAVLQRGFHSLPVFHEAYKKMKWVKKGVSQHFHAMHRRCGESLIPPQVVIYLDVPPEQCLENIKARGTPGEKHITLDYLKALEDAYHNFYFPKAKKQGTNVIMLDWSSPESMDDVILELDEMPTLQDEFSTWDRSNYTFLSLAEMLDDDSYLERIAYNFVPIEEMWDPDWTIWATDEWKQYTPWKFRPGYIPGKDKMIWLKE